MAVFPSSSVYLHNKCRMFVVEAEASARHPYTHICVLHAMVLSSHKCTRSHTCACACTDMFMHKFTNRTCTLTQARMHTHTGARPAGQSEWRWLAAECGSTCFPWDWPHTPAGARLAEEVALAHARAVSLRPLGKEPKPPGKPLLSGGDCIFPCMLSLFSTLGTLKAAFQP